MEPTRRVASARDTVHTTIEFFEWLISISLHNTTPSESTLDGQAKPFPRQWQK